MKRQDNFVIIISVLTLLIILVATTLFIGKSSVSEVRNNTKYFSINENIEIENVKTGEKVIKNLPCKLPTGEYSYTFKAIPFLNDSLYIYIHSSYIRYKLICEGNLILEYEPISTNIAESGGSNIKIIKVSDEFINKNITLTVSSIKKSNYGTRVPNIYLCNSNNMIFDSPDNKVSLLIYYFILMVFAVECLVFLIYLYKNKRGQLYYLFLPLVAVVVAFYLVVATPLSYYFADGKGSFLYIFEYILLMALPIPSTIFIIRSYEYEKSHKVYYKILKGISYIFIINIFVQILLTIFGIYEFMDMQKISHLSIFIYLLFMLTVPFISNSLRFIKISFIAVLTITTGAFTYVIVDYLVSAELRFLPIVGLSAIAFIGLEVWLAKKYYSIKYNDLYNAKLHKKLALKDSFTMLFNRAAFENDVKSLTKNEKGRNILVMIIDINNLKNINDTLGHTVGDDIILRTADILLDVKNNFENTESYRIGGDEFIILGVDVLDNLGDDIETYLRNKEYNIKNLSLAIGYETRKLEKDFDMKLFMEKVDKKMYINKEKLRNC